MGGLHWKVGGTAGTTGACRKGPRGRSGRLDRTTAMADGQTIFWWCAIRLPRRGEWDFATCSGLWPSVRIPNMVSPETSPGEATTRILQAITPRTTLLGPSP